MRPYSKYLRNIKSENQDVVYNLSGTTPPLSHAKKILEIENIQMDLTESRASRSYGEIKRKIADMSGFDGKNIEFFPGTSQAIFQLFAGLTHSGDTIAIETPGYSPVIDIARFLGLKILPFKRTQNFTKDLVNLRKLLKTSKLAFLTNPHCPSGMVLDSSQIDQLDQFNKPIILDEIYLPHFYQGQISLIKPSAKNLISISGFSKTVGISSLRLSWALGARKWLEKASLMGFNLIVELPTPSFVVGALVLEKWAAIIQSIDAVVEVNRTSLSTYRDILEPFLSHDLQKGHFAMLKKPKDISTEEQFIKLLKKESVFLRPGSDFRMKNHFRFHLMASPEDFNKALTRIARFYGR
jgi:aspartate/methionine/tyrosine aminotransferase